MTGILRVVAAGACASLLGGALLTAPSIATSDRAAKADYPQPKAGPWKFKDSFDGSSGTLKVKAGKNGKAPKVAKLTITVLNDPAGYMCPAPGSVAKVQGTFPLIKGPKWADDDFDEYFAWISAPKDKSYTDAYPNQLGMKPTPVTVKVGTETRNGSLAISFRQPRRNKGHALDYSLIVFAPGQSEVEDGYCLLYADDGKPGK